MSKLTAEDYLNWFKLKPSNHELPKLPKQRWHRDVSKHSADRSSIPPVPLYQRRELGQVYVQAYQEEYIRESQKMASGDISSEAPTCQSETASLCGSVHSDNERVTSSNMPVLQSSCFPPFTIGSGDQQSLLLDSDDVDRGAAADDETDTIQKDIDTVTIGPSLSGIDVDTIGGSLAGVGCMSVGTETLAQQQLAVYHQYDFTQYKEDVTRLPVYNHKKEILNCISNYQVIVIQGRTGCGKSTQVAQYILDEGAIEGGFVNICVTQPRKIAAITLAKRVCDERNWKLGSLVGYQVGLDNCTSEDTRLCYLTTEVLVQKMITAKSMSAYTHILLDEVHERDEHTDYALLLVKKLLNTVSSSVKVILMSATIDVDKFARYFSSPVMGHLVPSPIIAVGDAGLYHTSIFYLEQLMPIFRDMIVGMKDDPEPRVSAEMVDLVVEVVKCFDKVESYTPPPLTGEDGKAVMRGAVLVFVPGIMEIENFITKMRACAEQYKWVMHPLHSSITVDEQKEAFTFCQAGHRKIIIATNIAESSITVPDVRYVIDLCLTKAMHCDPHTNLTCLQLAWASKASCEQRAGRAGRTAVGRVYRMVTKSFWQRLASYSVPEMVRCPLSITVLKTKRLDMGEPAALLALALDPPNLADIARTILTLQQLGCLSTCRGGRVSPLDGELTYIGRVASQLPLDPHLSKLILLGQAFGCLREAIIIAASLSLKSFHSKPFQDELNAHLSKMSWAYGSFSDCIAMLNAYDVWQNLHCRQAFRECGTRTRRTRGIHEDCGGYSTTSTTRTHQEDGIQITASSRSCKITPAEAQWARQSYVQLQQLREVHKLVEELTERLKRLQVTPLNLQRPHTQQQETILKMCIAGAFYPHYFCRYNSPEHERETSEELCGHDPYSTVLVKRLPARGAVLYEQQIRDMFQECASDLTIEIENSTAFVMFRRHRSCEGAAAQLKNIPGEFPTAMYLALKMVQVPRIRDTLQLCLYSADDTDRMLKALEEEHCTTQDTASTLDGEGTVSSSLSRTVSCLSIDTSMTSPNTRLLRYGVRRVLSTSAVKIKPPELPGPEQITWRIRVLHVESAGRVWAISEDTTATEHLHFVLNSAALAVDGSDGDQLEEDEGRSAGGRYTSRDAPLPPGEPVLAPYTDDAGKRSYRRAQVEELRNSLGSPVLSKDEKHVQVVFVDYGHTAILPVTALRHMPNSLLSVPRLAVECCLAGIRPVSSSCHGAAWSCQANDFVRNTLTGNSYLVKVYSCVHGVMRVQLYERDHNANQLRCFNDLLVRKGFAVYAQEPMHSQTDHDRRQEFLNSPSSVYAPPPSAMGGFSYAAALSSSAVSTLSLHSAVSTLSLAAASDNGSKLASARPTKNKSRVLGPYSPLALRFCSLYRSTDCRSVRVEAGSVNSTALDMEPQNPHDRLLVASFVSLSGNESSLIVRNTTLMPPIPGLLSICCLTFSHVANMRVSEDGCEYTGAILGLGADPDTGHSLYPDEDIELAFDVPFTNDDLDKVNKVRYMLNQLLCAPLGEEGALHPAARADRQTLLRQELIQLLDENRVYKKPCYTKTPYKWNLIVESSLLCPYSEPDEELEGAAVYRLHWGVALRPHTPATLLARTRQMVREHKRLVDGATSRQERSVRVWQLCYACGQQLVTLQAVTAHLDSALHSTRVQELQRQAALGCQGYRLQEQ